MSINEVLHSICPSLSIKIALGIGLFNNALLAMGTERHMKYYEAAWNGEVSFIMHLIKIIFRLQCNLFLFIFRLLRVWQSQKFRMVATQNG